MEQQSPGIFLRICNILLAVACYLPFAWVIAFGSFVARAAKKLGHLPKYSGYGTDDIYVSKVHEEIVDLTFVLVFLSPVFVLIFALLTRPLSKSTFRFVNLILYGVAIFLSTWLFAGFFEWYVD